MQPKITAHAIRRYRERVKDMPDQEIRDYLSLVSQKAVDFGCRYVKLGTRHRLVLRGPFVVTVLPDDVHRASLRI